MTTQRHRTGCRTGKMRDIRVRIRTFPGGPRGTWPRPGRPPCWTRSPWRCRDLFGLAADIDIHLTRECDWGPWRCVLVAVWHKMCWIYYLRGYEQGIPLLQTKANKEGVNCPRSGPLVAGRLALLSQRDTAATTMYSARSGGEHGRVTTILLGYGLLGRGNTKYPGTPQGHMTIE